MIFFTNQRGRSMANMAGRSDDGSSDIVSMVDVLEEDNALEEEANAVLGASDDQNCTYSQGYVDRQALYSCVSCAPREDSPAGICFACSLHCHDGHDLVELYTKRNFRCDCGNSKFKDFTCKLFSGRDGENFGNSYNHNFQGKYCTCGKPYPDPDDEIEDEMIQCVACEDWYHSRHLGSLAPIEYQEMICDKCMQNLDFLRWYKSISVKTQDKSAQKTSVDGATPKNDKEKDLKEGTTKVEKEEKFANSADSNKSSAHTKTVVLQSSETSAESKICKLASLKTGNKDIDLNSTLKASFWPSLWRKLLCNCKDCQELYKSKGVSFLISEEDTVSAYEEKGKKNQANNTAYDKGMRALGSMDRINQVEVLTEYNDMKSELHDFFKSFAGEGKVVTKEDIEGFFAGMKARKRRRLDEGGSMQFHCK